MLGTNLHLITFLYLILELIIFIIQVTVCLTRPKDIRRVRFFILLLLFILFNLSNGLLPDTNFSIPILTQLIIAYVSGITLATYYFYFLTKELNIKSIKYYSPKFSLLSLLVAFFIGFVTTYLVTGDIPLSKEVFIIPPMIIALYFSIRTLIFIYKNQENISSHYKLVTLSGYIGIVFMASMPFVVYFGDDQSIKIALINISFILSAIAYYKNHIHQGKLEFQALEDFGFFSQEQNTQKPLSIIDPFLQYKLTPREFEVAKLIVLNMSYREVGETTSIEESTVSKHASNIFKKTNCLNKNEFIIRFSQNRP